VGDGPGGACACDADCPDVDGHAGVCVDGVCMTEASAECSADGSEPECPAGSRCWGIGSGEASLCWPDCASYPGCVGDCDDDGSCIPNDASTATCDEACASYCATDPVTGPGAPGSSCACDTDCTAVDGLAGACLAGVCYIDPGAACAVEGGEEGCGAGLHCWTTDLGDLGEAPVCWPSCAAYSCAGECDAEHDECAPNDTTDATCDPTCASTCFGTGTEECIDDWDCGLLEVCVDGECVFI